MRTSGEVTIEIDADPEAIYGLVADVTRIGEFSPECHQASWQPGGAATVGARFRGRNASRWIRWSRQCEVMVAEPGREFSFRTIPTVVKRDSTVWTYRFRAIGDGRTEATESYEIVQLPPKPMVAVIRRLLPHHLDMRPQMQATLEALKQTAEAGADESLPNRTACA